VADQSFAHGLIGVTLDGRYRLDAVLGEGGMGSVFRATQLAMDRKVAVKLLKPHLASDDDALQRFAREARVTLKVDSPHAVKILDFGVTPLRDYYMVLEYLDGRTVQRELDIDGAFAPARVAHIAHQALAALAAAHGEGLIHRDVKPDNLLLMRVGGDADYTKMLDFGVAKLMQGAAGDPALLALTAAGMVFGTPEFMSPEQALGQALDGRSDLYSLAVTMFVMLTGRAPFDGETAIEWLTHHVRTPAPRLAMVRPELAAYPELDDLLQRCLAKHRDQRPTNAAEMARLIAAVEPTLTRTAAPAPPAPPRPAPRPRTPTRVSSYVQALRDTDRAPAAPDDLGGLPTVLAATVRRPRRRPRFWLVGVAIAVLVGLGVGVTLQSPRNHTATAPPANPVGVPVAPPAIAGPTPAGSPSTASPANSVASAPPPVPPPPISPAPRPERRPPRAAAAPGEPTPPRSAEAEEHLRGAEDALQARNQLRQLAEADLALRADPRSVRAKYLLGDALIKGGDLDRGCSHLHALPRYAPAHDRARAAGCPGD
jgi:serine/threonine-protein kinase